MKTMHKILDYRGFLLCGFLLLSNALSAKGITFGKNYEWHYNVSQDVTVELKNYDCDISIETSASNNIRFEIQIDVESENREDIDVLSSYLESLTFPAKANLVKLQTVFWEKKDSNDKSGDREIKMKLRNGKTIKLSEFKIKANLYMPATAQLEFESKYSKIDLGNVQTLDLNSFDDKIKGDNVAGNVKILAKYSDMDFVQFGPTDLDLYDCNFTAEQTGNLDINSKYSEIKINDTGDIDIVGYQDDLDFNSIGQADIETKYSNINIAKAGDLIFSMYDSNVELTDAKNITISSSKYSEYKVLNCGRVTISDNYDDKYTIDQLVSLKSNVSKYTDFKLNNLDSYFEIVDGYDDNVNINHTSSTFTHLDVMSKYGDINLNTAENLPIRIDWQTKYGNLDIDESIYNTKIKINDHSEVQYVGIKGTESQKMPFVKIRGYDVKMRLDH